MDYIITKALTISLGILLVFKSINFDKIMEKVQFEDITSLIDNAVKEYHITHHGLFLDLRPSQLISGERFSILDSMSATEIFDVKMDHKANLASVMTLEKAIEEKLIKTPNQLDTQELIGILDTLLGKEMLFLNGQSLPHTIYTFSYLYDPSIYADHLILQPYLNGFHACGVIYQDLVKNSMHLREEDYIPTPVGFYMNKSYDEIKNDLIEAEGKFENDQGGKKKKKQNDSPIMYTENDALLARIKLRRGLFNLLTTIQNKLNPQKRDQILNNINFCLKNLEIIHDTFMYSKNCDNYFIEHINKTLICQISNRPLKTLTKEETYLQFKDMLNHFISVLEFSKIKNFYEIINTLDNFSKQPRNIISRAFLDINIFSQQGKLFGQYDLVDILFNTLKEFSPNPESFVATEALTKFLKSSTQIVEEFLAINLKSRSKQRRDISKLYASLNMLIHDSYSLDEKLYTKAGERIGILVIWSFDMGIKHMLKQMLMGFELNLYSDIEYFIIFYIIDHIYTLLDRNTRSFISRFDKDFLKAWQTKIGLDKKKKKLTDFQRKYFYENLLQKAIESYFRAMLRLSCVLIKNGIIKNTYIEDEKALENRFYLRLKIFENVYFAKKLEFVDFKVALNEIGALDMQKVFTDFKENLDSSVKLLNEITNEDVFNEEARATMNKIKRVFVLNSMSITKLNTNKAIINKAKISFKNTEHPFYPIIDVTF